MGTAAALAVLGGAGERARAATAGCAQTDPQDFKAVYACMSSIRARDGRNMLEGNIGAADCKTIRIQYTNALLASGVSRPAAEHLLPECALFARAAEEFTGSKPYWAGCLGFGERPLREHMGACLATFVPGYYGTQGTARRLQGCGDAIRDYERGLRAADPHARLPVGYSTPDCTLVAAAIGAPAGEGGGAARMPAGRNPAAAWGPCMNYDPANVEAHLKGCLGQGTPLASLRDCRDVRRAYEAKLIQANGGLPPDYVVLPCSVTEGVLQLAEAERERRQTHSGPYPARPRPVETGTIWPSVGKLLMGFAALAALYKALPEQRRRMLASGRWPSEDALDRALAFGGHAVAAALAAAGTVLLGKDFLIGALIGAAFMAMAQAVLLPRM